MIIINSTLLKIFQYPAFIYGTFSVRNCKHKRSEKRKGKGQCCSSPMGFRNKIKAKRGPSLWILANSFMISSTLQRYPCNVCHRTTTFACATWYNSTVFLFSVLYQKNLLLFCFPLQKTFFVCSLSFNKYYSIQLEGWRTQLIPEVQFGLNNWMEPIFRKFFLREIFKQTHNAKILRNIIFF